MSLGTGRRAVMFIALIQLMINVSYSGIDRLMKHVERDGGMSNSNKGAIIKDQQGGYMTGGSILLRGPAPKSLQPLTVQTPKFAYDACTGSADFRFGGLSYVTSTELVKFMKNLAAASGVYGFKMLLKTVCPQRENIMMDLEAIARDVNGLMMDQCSAAQKIGGGVYGALTNGNAQKCMMQSNMTGGGKDMYETTEKCKSNPDRYGDTGENNELKSMLGNEFNLVWKAITRGEGDDKAFKELIMSVSGTIIGRKVDGKYHFTPKPSLVLSNDLPERYIGTGQGGSKVKLYRCNDSGKCLDPKEEETGLSREETLYGNVSRILTGMVEKVKLNNGEKLTDEEEALISFSTIPLINLIEMEIVSKAKTEDMMTRVSEFIEVLCYDVITNFLSQMVLKAQTSVEALEYSQVADIGQIREFTERAELVKGYLRDAKHGAFRRMQTILNVKERLIQQEKVWELGFTRFMNRSN